ncbi:MAG: cohesin domain-containing protein [Candidatus Bathyarchaeia archaeon]
MGEKIKTTLIMATLLFAMLSFTLTTLFAQTSPSDTTLYVDPPSIEDPTILPGDTIIIKIMIDAIANMKNCEFNLTFNPNVLSVKQVTKQLVQGQYPNTNVDVDDVVGYVWVNLTYTTAVTVTTDTALVEIKFFVKGYGTSPLHFESSALKDNAGTPIPHDTQDGFVRIFVRNITVQDIVVLYHETYVGRVIPINVTVLNDGDIPESFSVSLFYNSTLIATQNVVDLLPKENTTLTFNWDTAAVPPSLDLYVIRAEASILPNELNTADNTLEDGTVKLKIVGDVNGDGIVDIDDLIAWDAAYESHSGDPNWNEQADLNYDGKVDKADAMIILENYHEKL